jgi:mevalonate kinase
VYEKLDDLYNLENRSEHEQMGASVFLNSAKHALEEDADEKMKQIANKYSFDISIGFGVPIGAGLGSSASFNSVASGAVYSIFKHIQKEIPSEISISDEDINIIKYLTDFGEKLIHGNPSGIDSYIINNGGTIKFTKTSDGTSLDKSVQLPETLNFDIVYSGVSRSTKTALKGMIDLKTKFPGKLFSHYYIDVFNSLLSSIGVVTNEFELECKHLYFDFYSKEI